MGLHPIISVSGDQSLIGCVRARERAGFKIKWSLRSWCEAYAAAAAWCGVKDDSDREEC